MGLIQGTQLNVVFSIAAIAIIFLLLPFFKKRLYIKIFLIIVVIVLGIRYFIWRTFYTLNFETTLSSIISIILYIAELYGYIHLILFYFQTYRPTDWKTPSECNEFPSVDVFITTINEPIEIIKRTAIACKSLDWPTDKLNVYILDDGGRKEVKQLAEKLSCNYITRQDTKGAKAGNINNALKLTNGEFIFLLDVDHTPVRSYLKETIPFLRMKMSHMFTHLTTSIIQIYTREILNLKGRLQMIRICSLRSFNRGETILMRISLEAVML